MRLILVSVAVLTLLGACSNGEKTARYLIDPPVTGGSVPNRLGTADPAHGAGIDHELAGRQACRDRVRGRSSWPAHQTACSEALEQSADEGAKSTTAATTSHRAKQTLGEFL